MVLFGAACRKITSQNQGQPSTWRNRYDGSTLSNGVDDALATGAGRGFARLLQACSLHKRGTASTPIITIDLNLVSRFVREFHLGSGAALYNSGSPA